MDGQTFYDMWRATQKRVAALELQLAAKTNNAPPAMTDTDAIASASASAPARATQENVPEVIDLAESDSGGNANTSKNTGDMNGYLANTDALASASALASQKTAPKVNDFASPVGNTDASKDTGDMNDNIFGRAYRGFSSSGANPAQGATQGQQSDGQRPQVPSEPLKKSSEPATQQQLKAVQDAVINISKRLTKVEAQVADTNTQMETVNAQMERYNAQMKQLCDQVGNVDYAKLGIVLKIIRIDDAVSTTRRTVNNHAQDLKRIKNILAGIGTQMLKGEGKGKGKEKAIEKADDQEGQEAAGKNDIDDGDANMGNAPQPEPAGMTLRSATKGNGGGKTAASQPTSAFLRAMETEGEGEAQKALREARESLDRSGT